MALRILFVAAEVAPFSKTGGLGDVSAALAKHLARRGHDVLLVTPAYGPLVEAAQGGGVQLLPHPRLQDLPVELGRRRWVSFSTAPLSGDAAREGPRVFFLRCPELYARDAIYTSDPDEPSRFALLSCAAFVLCQHLRFAPDVVHVHDWHAALAPLQQRTAFGWDQLFDGAASLLTIHNLGYQGTFASHVVGELGLAGELHLLPAERLSRGELSFLEAGILHADAVSTVSETYAREILGPDHGMGLDRVLRGRSEPPFGIVNGIDEEVWDPARDPWLAESYSRERTAGKLACKRALLAELGLPFDERAPAVGMITRLVEHKGADLAAACMASLLEVEDLRLVVLGSGEERYERLFAELRSRHPQRVAFRAGYDEGLAHRIEGGCDLFLMPSRYEPCGLNQLYSLRYGTIPVVRRTGGLADTVRPWDAGSAEGTGFLFDEATSEALGASVRAALATWRDARQRARLIANGMAEDWGWGRQSGRYVELYERLLAARERARAPTGVARSPRAGENEAPPPDPAPELHP